MPTSASPFVADDVILLPPPLTSGGRSLTDALNARRTTRDLAATDLPMPLLSNLLWAAGGINRPATHFHAAGRTAASAGNSQEIEVYALLARGAYLYDPVAGKLERKAAGDLRALGLTIGQRGAETRAPAQILLVTDTSRLSHSSPFKDPGLTDPAITATYAAFDAGLVAQNIYLFAAANGLAAWLHNCDREGLHKALGLPDAQRPLYSISVGYPATRAAL